MQVADRCRLRQARSPIALLLPRPPQELGPEHEFDFVSENEDAPRSFLCVMFAPDSRYVLYVRTTRNIEHINEIKTHVGYSRAFVRRAREEAVQRATQTTRAHTSRFLCTHTLPPIARPTSYHPQLPPSFPPSISLPLSLLTFLQTLRVLYAA